MNLREHDGRDDMKVWLADDEVNELLGVAADAGVEHYLAIGLGIRCGLRSVEVLNITPHDVQESNTGQVVRVRDGKGGKYRETPIPTTLATTISTIADIRDASVTEPLLDVTTRTLRRWVSAAGLELAEMYDDDGWRFLSFHDLRRTWATSLASSDVDPLIVLQWGGWSDLKTFLDHYQGVYSPEAQRREQEKVPWL